MTACHPAPPAPLIQKLAVDRPGGTGVPVRVVSWTLLALRRGELTLRCVGIDRRGARWTYLQSVYFVSGERFYGTPYECKQLTAAVDNESEVA